MASPASRGGSAASQGGDGDPGRAGAKADSVVKSGILAVEGKRWKTATAMLPRELLRSEPRRVAAAIEARGVDAALVDQWTASDRRRREALTELEELRHRRRLAGREIGKLKAQGKAKEEDAAGRILEMTELKARIEGLEDVVAQAEEQLRETELKVPNIAHDTVPVGSDEAANRVERLVGEPPRFDFEPRNHWDIGPELGILDFERGAKLAGARFVTYVGLGARLERALAAFMLDLHTEEHGYTEVLPPFLVKRDCLLGSGQLPKFEEDLFHVQPDARYLIPTGEVPLVNLHAGEVLEEDELPLRYAALTPCFRAEAGSYGRDVRGLIRLHQFQKVELVQLTTPEASHEALEQLTAQAEKVLQRLELPYRVVCLSTGDMGFAMAKTYDLEVWLPGQATYREISSCSNAEAFQARRVHTRYRPQGGGGLRHVHTLNGSGLAVGRTLVALLENYQTASGSVRIPEALRPYVGVEEIPAG